MTSSPAEAISINLAGVIAQGDMAAIVSVDDTIAFRSAITGDLAVGGTQVGLGSYAASAAHTVTVQFIDGNDIVVSGAARLFAARYLQIDGIDTGNAAILQQAGTVTFQVPAASAAAPVLPGSDAGQLATMLPVASRPSPMSKSLSEVICWDCRAFVASTGLRPSAGTPGRTG